MSASGSAPPAGSGSAGSKVPSAVLEVIGYGGAAAALAASSIAVGDLSSESTQILTNVAIVVVLFIAGWYIGISDRDALHRMRSVFWFFGLVAWVSAAGLVLMKIDETLDPRWLVVVTAALGAALAFPMWRIERRSLQLIGLFLTLWVAAVAIVYTEKTEYDPFVGPQQVPNTALIALVTVGFGVAAGILGLRDRVRPRRTSMVLGSIAMILGALFVDVEFPAASPSTAAIVIALVVAVAVLAVATTANEPAPAGIGIVGVLVMTSALVGDSVNAQGVAIGVLAVGLALVVAAIVLVRFAEGAPETATVGTSGSLPPAPPPPT